MLDKLRIETIKSISYEKDTIILNLKQKIVYNGINTDKVAIRGTWKDFVRYCCELVKDG